MRLAKLHRGDDLAAGRIEQDDAVQIAAPTFWRDEIDEGVGRVFADLAFAAITWAQRAPQLPLDAHQAEIHLLGPGGARRKRVERY